MRNASSRKPPVYPRWSAQCDHAYGIPFSEAVRVWEGHLFSTMEDRRRRLLKQPSGELSESDQRQILSEFWGAVREKKSGFRQLIVRDHYFTTGIRWPFAENPEREEIPFELWLDLKYDPEEDKARGWSLLEERIVTYVKIRVSAKFSHTHNYRHVAIRNLEFRFNETQSKIIRRLHQAFLNGEHEGLPAKKFMYELGLGSSDIGDYFHDQPFWHELIRRIGPGQYRLNAYGLGY